jgi:hypothetical protein
MAKKKRFIKAKKAPKPKVKSKLIKTKYTGPGPRQVVAAAISRRNEANGTKRRRRIATY